MAFSSWLDQHPRRLGSDMANALELARSVSSASYLLHLISHSPSAAVSCVSVFTLHTFRILLARLCLARSTTSDSWACPPRPCTGCKSKKKWPKIEIDAVCAYFFLCFLLQYCWHRLRTASGKQRQHHVDALCSIVREEADLGHSQNLGRL